MDALNETAHNILDRAEHYTQTHGFNAFSYRDIQHDLGIKTSSIHYYFPTKQDLALCMIDRYLERYQLTLNNIAQSNINALQKLQKLADIFIATFKAKKFCLCGMMALDIVTMPEPMNKRLALFFQVSETWIARVINEGITDKSIRDSVNPEYEAAHYLATLEGCLLIARIRQRSNYLPSMIKALLNTLAT